MNSLFTDKFDNLDEIEQQFLERYSLPKFIQVERDNLKGLIFITEIHSSNFPRNKLPCLVSLINSTKKFRNNTIFSQSFSENLSRRVSLNSSCEGNITLVPKLCKDIIRRENYGLMSFFNIDTESLNIMY